MSIARNVMELIVIALSLVGGYAVAGWIGLGVVVAFLVTMLIDLRVRLRSPKGRVMRQIAHELRDVSDDDLVVAKLTKVHPCDHHAHPAYGAHNQPTATLTDDED